MEDTAFFIWMLHKVDDNWVHHMTIYHTEKFLKYLVITLYEYQYLSYEASSKSISSTKT